MARCKSNGTAFFKLSFAGGKVLAALRSVVKREVAERFGEKQENLCPGESHCDQFKSAAGATREQKEANACSGKPKCPLFPTKPRDDAEPERWQSIVDAAFQIRREKLAGYKRHLSEIYHIEFIALLLIEEYFEMYRNFQQQSLVDLLAAFLGAKRK